jgi:hypothetical protein
MLVTPHYRHVFWTTKKIVRADEWVHLRSREMKRIRLSTLMLMVIIIALGTALVVQHRREAELQARLAESLPMLVWRRKAESHWERDKRAEDKQRLMNAVDAVRPGPGGSP